MKDWGGERLRHDKRWQYGVSPVRNANFAWVQHIVHHLPPTEHAAFVLANWWTRVAGKEYEYA